MSTTPLTLSFAGQQPPIALPQVPGTRGPVGVDMRGLNQSGFCSYDPGFANTAGCQSAISWIDTENSVLLHRGYPVDQLARQCDFLEVAYIMLNGDAPDEASYQTFRETITRHTLVHEQIARMCSGFRRDSHPMALMCALVGALAVRPRGVPAQAVDPLVRNVSPSFISSVVGSSSSIGGSWHVARHPDAIVATGPPSMRRAQPRVSAVATTLRASASNRENVGRDIPIRRAASV